MEGGTQIVFRAAPYRRISYEELFGTYLHTPLPKPIQLHLQPVKLHIPRVVLIAWYTPSHRCCNTPEISAPSSSLPENGGGMTDPCWSRTRTMCSD